MSGEESVYYHLIGSLEMFAIQLADAGEQQTGKRLLDLLLSAHRAVELAAPRCLFGNLPLDSAPHLHRGHRCAVERCWTTPDAQDALDALRNRTAQGAIK